MVWWVWVHPLPTPHPLNVASVSISTSTLNHLHGDFLATPLVYSVPLGPMVKGGKREDRKRMGDED